MLFPAAPRFANYSEAWAAAPFGHFFLNSFAVTAVVLVSNLVVSRCEAHQPPIGGPTRTPLNPRAVVPGTAIGDSRTAPPAGARM